MKTDAADRLAASAVIDRAIASLQAARSAVLTGDAEDAVTALTEAAATVKVATFAAEGVADAVWCEENPEELAALDASCR